MLMGKQPEDLLVMPRLHKQSTLKLETAFVSNKNEVLAGQTKGIRKPLALYTFRSWWNPKFASLKPLQDLQRRCRLHTWKV